MKEFNLYEDPHCIKDGWDTSPYVMRVVYEKNGVRYEELTDIKGNRVKCRIPNS